MAVRIRLTRMGTKKRPFYRVIAADSRSPRNGRFIEILGTYNPLTDPAEIKLNREKVLDWIKKGAQPTEIVRDLMRKTGIVSVQPSAISSQQEREKETDRDQ